MPVVYQEVKAVSDKKLVITALHSFFIKFKKGVDLFS